MHQLYSFRKYVLWVVRKDYNCNYTEFVSMGKHIALDSLFCWFESMFECNNIHCLLIFVAEYDQKSSRR